MLPSAKVAGPDGEAPGELQGHGRDGGAGVAQLYLLLGVMA